MISFFKILQFVRNDRKRSQRLINHLIREKRVFLITIFFLKLFWPAMQVNKASKFE